MTVTWKFLIDWDRNDSYDETMGSLENVTSFVVSAEWVLGIQKAYQDIADNSVLKLVLNNADKRFSPENNDATNPLRGLVAPFLKICLKSTDGADEKIHWMGWLDTIQPGIGRNGERLVQIIASGPMQFLKAVETRLTLQENKRTDEIVTQLLREVVIPPGVKNSWVLGLNPYSTLDTSTWLVDPTAASNSEVEPGLLTLEVAADNWVIEGGPANAPKRGFSVYQALQDITAAERGKFFFDRTGKAIFWNRHHLLQGGTPSATFTDTMTDMAYTYANLDEMKNDIVLVVHPRVISQAADETLWDLDGATIQLSSAQGGKPGQCELFVIYKDEKDKRIGGKDITVQDVEIDLPYLWTSSAVRASVEPKANGALLRFVNTSTQDVKVTKCKIKGRKITDSGETEIKAIDTESQAFYGQRTLRLNLPSITSLPRAQSVADFERDRRGKPFGSANTITVMSHGKQGSEHLANQRALIIGSLISVAEGQSGHGEQTTQTKNTKHGNTYYVIGEAHELSKGATLWKTTWYLEPAPPDSASYWKLGVAGRGELDTVARLAI